MSDPDVVVYDAAEIAAATGSLIDDDPAGTVEDAALAVVDGEIARLGPTADVTREYPPENAALAIDASGRAVLPGFVDSHTHALFAGDRSDEFEAKLQGASYQELLAQGGGIHRTVESTRAASSETLLDNLLGHLDVMLAHGTTTVEVKSGYGLNRETELRMLDVIASADDRHPVDVVPTFMGAHAVPDEMDAEEYVDRVVDEQLPAVAEQGIAEFCDVFCEEGVFSVEQSRHVLEAGREHGLTPKVHAEELTHLGGSQLAADIEAASADHLLHATGGDVQALVEADVTPVLLPGTAFGLGDRYADGRAMIDAGASVAIASDFNPNCHTQNVGFAASLACVEMGLTPAEALVAATRNGARALDRAPLGALQEGASADLAIIDGPSHVHVPYSYGVNRVETVLKRGRVVHDRSTDGTGDVRTTASAGSDRARSTGGDNRD